MSYNIIKTDGTPLATVADGQTNSTASSLTLIGKNYAGYGTFLNQNFVKLLENFSAATAPLYPLVGQLWWKSDTRLLQVYDKFGTWKTISGAQSQSDAPTNAITGDLWFDTVNLQLKTYSGASWIVIGPSFTATTGTSGAIADTIVDNYQYSHVVVKFFVQNNLIAILSKDATFAPGTTIAGFDLIKPGFNLASNRVPALVYYDNANNSSYLGQYPASSYVRKTVPTFDGKVVIQNPEGVEITEVNGTTSYFEMKVAANYVNLVSKPRGYGFVFKTVPDSGGLEINALTIDRTTGAVSVAADPTTALGVATKAYVDGKDTVLSTQIATAQTTLNSTISTLTANTTSVYGNTRVIQSELGIATGPTLSNSSAWNQILASGQNFSTNVVALWSNVAAIHANVLSNQGNAPDGTASMYSNVRLLQNSLSTLSGKAVLIDGTAQLTGTLVPATENLRDLGSAALRFRNFFANTANVAGITHSGTNGSGDIGQVDNRFGSAFVSNVTAPIGTSYFYAIDKSGTSGTGDIGGSSSRFGTLYVTDINSTGGIGGSDSTATFHSIAHGGTSASGDIGSSSNKFGTVYASSFNGAGALSSLVVSGTTQASDSTSGAITTLGGIGVTKNVWAGGSGYFAALGKTGGGSVSTDNIGSSADRWSTVYATTFDGTATAAKYADLAERYEADAAYEPGTVVTIGGAKEITQENTELSENVFGVISTNPAHLMNSAAGENDTHPPVALTGRVPCKVAGPVAKGQRLVSAGNGQARGAKLGEATAFNVIGRALSAKETDEVELLEITVQAK